MKHHLKKKYIYIQHKIYHPRNKEKKDDQYHKIRQALLNFFFSAHISCHFLHLLLFSSLIRRNACILQSSISSSIPNQRLISNLNFLTLPTNETKYILASTIYFCNISFQYVQQESNAFTAYNNVNNIFLLYNLKYPYGELNKMMHTKYIYTSQYTNIYIYAYETNMRD